MSSLIENLFNGELSYCEHAFPNLDEFIHKLGEERKKDLDELTDDLFDTFLKESVKNFTDGFSLGVRLMCEAFTRKDVEPHLRKIEKLLEQDEEA